jgi:hypothetical protein
MHPKDNFPGRMSLSDKESDESESLRRLLVGYSADEIELTKDGSPFVITHKPSACSDCTEWFKDVRQITSDHPDLIGGSESELGYVKGSVFATRETTQRRRLDEIAQLLDRHLKRVQRASDSLHWGVGPRQYSWIKRIAGIVATPIRIDSVSGSKG